ncbi:MAG TPA: ParB/RepB/Spo0J family partition protein [bacterium (Candidatus Stahlbacteria)]|nr:ParB/RepB/Spo0J family partition protein [Candidatus Stahlbacteria bacterium]
MPRLGKGLDALISKDTKEAVTSRTVMIPIAKITRNPYQPRRGFDEARLAELASSIKENGIIQPIIVRKKGDGYELVVGERRLRAAKIAGLEEIPAIQKDLKDQDLLAVTLIENLQREDLNPIEEAEGYQQLITTFKLSQAEVAKLTNKDRSTIANKLRLLTLPAKVKGYLSNGSITEGHARALLGLGPGFDLVSLCRRIKNEGLSVRAIERLAKRKRKKKKVRSPYSEIEDFLSKKLGSKVIINWRGKKGKMIVELYNEEDLERIIEIISGHGKD